MARRKGNRAALLEGAVRCIQERGYGHTTARDLVEVSDTNLAAIGYHFGSKEVLLNEALAECGRRWLDQIAQLAAHAGDEGAGGWETVVTAIHRSVEEGRPIAIGYLEAWTQAQRSPELRDQLARHYREIRSTTAAIATASVRGGAMHVSDSEELGAVLVAVADGLIVQWLLDPDALPDPARLARILAPLIPGS
jgi:AcrR family transcriptional regulator